MLNYVNLLLENAFPLTSKLKPVLLTVVCGAYVHHCECATLSDTNLVTLHSCNFSTMPAII